MVLFSVEKALRAEFGTPRGVPWGLELRSEHSPQYTGGDCEALCHYWGIEHTLAPVGGFLWATRWPNVLSRR